jgi:isoquinoline 1-oxidoreductase beta subunit
MRQGRYHPVMQCRLTGGLDANNNLVGLHMRLSGQSIFSAVLPQMVEKDKGRDAFVFQGVTAPNLIGGEYALQYSVPNLLIDHAMRNTHVPPGVWRGVNINQNCIFIECFMDELAQAAGQDELEFRRKLMAKHPRALAVLNAVAERIGWGKPPPQGVHRGLAHMKAFNAYVAAAAEVSVAGNNRIKIHRIVAATDPTHAVNPAQIERQVAGSFVMGLSAAFFQECTVEKGRIVEGNFDTYDTMRIAQMPPVETIVMPSGGNDPWGGIGEPTICVAAPAVLNAYAKATGRRIRSIPLKNERVRMA